MLYWICYIIAYLPILIFWPTKIIGKENFIKNSKAIYVCNHQSNWDCITLAHKHGKKMFFLAKVELFKNKFSAWWLKKFGAIAVDRKKVGISSIKQCLEVLNKNRQLLIFPKGTRSTSAEEVENLKHGMAMFALKSGAPIVPMIINKKTKFLRRNKLIVGKAIDITPFQKDGLTHENLNKISNLVSEEMEKLIKEVK